MVISPLGLYAKVQRLSEGPAAPAAGPSAANPAAVQSFMDAVAQASKRALATVQEGEQAALGGLAGAMDTQQVVAAMTRAELTIQATIAIRDKMVQAYQEIMRMPV